MAQAFGELLPLAVGIAVSPVPVIAVTLVLMSPRRRRSGVAFLMGWVVGLTAMTAILVALSGYLPGVHSEGPQPAVAIVRILIGLGIIVAATWKLFRRSASSGLPRWMLAVETMSSARTLLVALALAIVNPKHLLLVAAAATSIAEPDDLGGVLVLGLAFVLIAGSSVIVTVAAALVAGRRFDPILERLRGWLERHHAAIMAVVLIVIGFVVLGQGIESL